MGLIKVRHTANNKLYYLIGPLKGSGVLVLGSDGRFSLASLHDLIAIDALLEDLLEDQSEDLLEPWNPSNEEIIRLTR